MDIRRSGERYEGSLTRVGDELCLPFDGILELLAALETLESDDPDEPNPSPGGDRRSR